MLAFWGAFLTPRMFHLNQFCHIWLAPSKFYVTSRHCRQYSRCPRSISHWRRRRWSRYVVYRKNADPGAMEYRLSQYASTAPKYAKVERLPTRNTEALFPKVSINRTTICNRDLQSKCQIPNYTEKFSWFLSTIQSVGSPGWFAKTLSSAKCQLLISINKHYFTLTVTTTMAERQVLKCIWCASTMHAVASSAICSAATLKLVYIRPKIHDTSAQ